MYELEKENKTAAPEWKTAALNHVKIVVTKVSFLSLFSHLSALLFLNIYSTSGKAVGLFSATQEKISAEISEICGRTNGDPFSDQ